MRKPEIDDAAYPPAEHILRDLRIVIERDAEGIEGQIEIVPAILDDSRRPRLGILATLADVVAGELAIRAILPDWTATSNLNVDVGDLPGAGRISAVPKVLRKTRQTVVLEVSIRAQSESGVATEIGVATEAGVATLGFSILPAKSDFQSGGHFARNPERRSEMGLATSGFDQPLLERIGLEPNPQIKHGIRLPEVLPYHRNSLGALQGGLVATILEAAAERFAHALLKGPVRCRSLSIHFLKLGRRGPIVSRARVIARSPTGLSVRIELHDEGSDNALLSVATVQVDETDPVA